MVDKLLEITAITAKLEQHRHWLSQARDSLRIALERMARLERQIRALGHEPDD